MMKDEPLREADCVRDLGIVMDKGIPNLQTPQYTSDTESKENDRTNSKKFRKF